MEDILRCFEGYLLAEKRFCFVVKGLSNGKVDLASSFAFSLCFSFAIFDHFGNPNELKIMQSTYNWKNYYLKTRKNH